MFGTRYRTVLHKAAVSEIRALPPSIKQRVKEVIDGLAEIPVPQGAARLKGRTNAYRIRFGDYRLIYEVHATEIVVYVVGVAHRKEVYKRLLRRR
jgi:mRNA interferase RelE/StbE